MAFRWRADDGPLIVLFGSSLSLSKKWTPSEKTFWVRACRTANSRGLVHSSFPLDLDVEHENKVFKEYVTTYRGEVAENIIKVVSRSAEMSESIIKKTWTELVVIFDPETEKQKRRKDDQTGTQAVYGPRTTNHYFEAAQLNAVIDIL